MAEASFSTTIGPGPQDRRSTHNYGTIHPISCTLCRQRKVKCDKVHPCAPCQRSGMECIFPERVKHSKRRRGSSRATSNDLLERLSRMEHLIEKMEVNGELPAGPVTEKSQTSIQGANMPLQAEIIQPQSLSDQQPVSLGDGLNRFIGSNFWRSLTDEVEGLRQTVYDDSDGDDALTPNSAQSPPENSSSHTSIVFESTQISSRNLRSLHPLPAHISMLCSIFISNVDPMFKILHIPTLQTLVTNAIANLDDLPSGNYVEALLFTIYYASITTLTPDQCLQTFQVGRETLLERYRLGVEKAFSNASFMINAEVGTLQALTIFLMAARANDDTKFVWSMTALAVRLAQSMELHTERANSGLSPFMQELRRRLWWGLVALDIRCATDRATEPILRPSGFDTQMPLNINDCDMEPSSNKPIIGRNEFTEMTKSTVSHKVAHTAWMLSKAIPFTTVQSGPEELKFDMMTVQDKKDFFTRIEKMFEMEILIYCDPGNMLGWVTMVVSNLILSKLRLAIFHPVHSGDRIHSQQGVHRDSLLKTAVENVEYSNLLDTHPGAAQWRWFFKTYVQWHALATILAELCVRTRGPLVERAWRIVDLVFDPWGARVADSSKGMLWRPMKRLMSKAQAKRAEVSHLIQTLPNTSLQQPLPTFLVPSDFSIPESGLPNYDLDRSQMPDPTTSYSTTLSQETPPEDCLAQLNVNDNDSDSAINWAEFDEFMQDFEMADTIAPGTFGLDVPLQSEDKSVDRWW